MTRKVYRTAQGKMVDLGALQLRNESVRAVGNMKVNARGDLLDSSNRTIDPRNQQVARQYRRQVSSNVKDDPVRASAKSKTARPTPPEDFQDDFVRPEPAAPIVSEPTAVTGLAAAIARAREIRQDPLRTHQIIAEHQSNANKS